MEWDVEYTHEFEDWWQRLSEGEQESIVACVSLLMKRGPNLLYPYSSGRKKTKLSHLRELRVQHQGRPLRIFYAFDPRRCAILLIGGDKTGDNQFYERYVPLAEKIYAQHLQEIQREEE